VALKAEKRSLPRWPPVEPIAPMEIKPLPSSWLRVAPTSEPERPIRWVWIVLGVIVLFALTAGGGYYLLSRPGQPPVTAQVVPSLNAAAKHVPAAAERAAIPAPQLIVGLLPLTDQRSPDKPAAVPAAPQSGAPTPGQPPNFAVGLRPITEQVPPAVPTSTAQAPPPAQPPPATVPRPKSSRKTAVHRSAPVPSPSQSPGTVKF
jgi:hypothetical protein